MHNSSTASNESKQVQRQESGWKSTVAGLGAAAIATLVGHPMDTMKVRLQNSHGPSSLMHIVRHTFRHEGVAGFYKGVVPPVIGRSWTRGVKFGTYGSILAQRQRASEDGATLSLHDYMIAGGVGGAASGAIGTPVELVKTRLQMQHHRSRGVGTVAMLKHIVRVEGVRRLFRGAAPAVLHEAPYYMFYFSAFNSLKQALPDDVRGSNPLGVFLLGGICGTIPWVLFYPTDTLRSKMMCRSSGNQTMSVVLANTIKADGARGLYRGLLPCVLRAFPVHATQFLAYETLLDCLHYYSSAASKRTLAGV
eukprot:PhM_4_TR11813/c0_g2_i1/m.58930